MKQMSVILFILSVLCLLKGLSVAFVNPLKLICELTVWKTSYSLDNLFHKWLVITSL